MKQFDDDTMIYENVVELALTSKWSCFQIQGHSKSYTVGTGQTKSSGPEYFIHKEYKKLKTDWAVHPQYSCDMKFKIMVNYKRTGLIQHLYLIKILKVI